MKNSFKDAAGLLHRSRNDIMIKFGVPDVDYCSICAYFRQKRIMILVFGLEKNQGRLEETVQGYALGTEFEGVVSCEGITLFDGREDELNLPEGMTLEQLCQQYTVVDIGSGTCCPAMVGSQCSMWLVKLDREGKVLSLQEEKMKPELDAADDVEAIFRQIMEKE